MGLGYLLHFLVIKREPVAPFYITLFFRRPRAGGDPYSQIEDIDSRFLLNGKVSSYAAARGDDFSALLIELFSIHLFLR